MAGSQDPSDNPVGVNVVPLVDIIFCLCVFFMCSFKFRQLEGKFDSWLPDKGSTEPPTSPEQILHEVRVALTWDEATRTVIRKLGVRTFPENRELENAIADGHAAWVRLGKPDTPVTIDADPRVPWDHVVDVVNLAKRRGIEKIEFAMGAPPAARRSSR